MQSARLLWPRWASARLGLKQNDPGPAEGDDEPDDWEPGEGFDAEFGDWDEVDDQIEPEPEPGDFWHEPQWDDD